MLPKYISAHFAIMHPYACVFVLAQLKVFLSKMVEIFDKQSIGNHI